MPLTATHLGPYEIISQIGAGGMGEVYQARDQRLDRTVALKVLPADLAADPDRMMRFTREAKAASALSNPNVAHIYDIGQADGISFIAMEYVEGQRLDAKIGGRPMQISQIVEIGIQIADALDEAHSKGITHRDIKPGNIIITPRGQVKVLDFGLAKIAKQPITAIASNLDTAAKTDRGVILGTVQYMSPEQALAKEMDHRTDIFSQGVVLYEMTTGRLPFIGASASQTLDRIIHNQPDAISRFNSNVPLELERIIRKCLEKDRDRRYQSARELLIDLKNLKRDTEPGAAKSTLGVTRGLTSVRRIVMPLLALLLLAIASVAIYLIVPQRKAINSLAILPFVNASGDPNMEYLSDGLADSLIKNLSQLSKLRLLGSSTVSSYKGRQVDPRKIGQDFKIRAVLTGKITQQGDKLIVQAELVDAEDGSRLWGERYDGTPSEMLSIQKEITREVSETLRLKLTEAERKLLARNYTKDAEAYQLYLKGRHFWIRRTTESRRKAIDFFNQAIKRDPTYALAYAGLADSYAHMGWFGELPDKEATNKTAAMASKAVKLDDTLGEAHNSLAAFSELIWDWPRAEKEYKRAIELNSSYSTAHQWYGEYLLKMGRIHEGITELKRAVDLDPLSIAIAQSLADLLYLTGRYDDAIEQCRKILELEPNQAGCNGNLSLIYAIKGMYKESIEVFSKESKPEVAAAVQRDYEMLGYQEAMKRYFQRDIAYGKECQCVAPVDMGSMSALIGDNDRAFEWFEKAYGQRSIFLPMVLSYMRFDPRDETIRKDPRWANLLHRVGLPVASDQLK